MGTIGRTVMGTRTGRRVGGERGSEDERIVAQLPLASLRLGLEFCLHLSCILSFIVCRRDPSSHWVLFLFANLWLLRRLKPWFV